MKTTSLLLLCCLLCLAVFIEAGNKKEGKSPKKHGRGHGHSDSSSDSDSHGHGHRRSHRRGHERKHKKCPRLQALTWKELQVLQAADKTEWVEKPIALGEATFRYDRNGEIEATCKCKPANVPGYNIACQFKFDNGSDNFYSQNAITVSVNGNDDGRFGLVKTKGELKIKCDKRKGQIRVNGTAIKRYTCFSGVFKNDCKAPSTSNGPPKTSCKKMCPALRSLSWEELVKYSNTWANLPYKLQPIAMGETSFKSTPKGIEMTCSCAPVKGKNNYCALEFDNGFDSFWTQNALAINQNNKRNGHFEVIESKDFVTIKCDSNSGSILVNGTALTNYVCYSAHFFNDCTLPPTGNVAQCKKHRPHHSKKHHRHHSNSDSNSDSNSNSGQRH